MNRTVVVEQQYNPDIMDAQKVNVVPKVEEIKVSPRTVVYDNKLSLATSFPAETMGVYAAKEEQENPMRGYVRLGYGAYGNLDAHANYLFTPSGNDKLNILFDMDGRSGKLRMYDSDNKWKSHYYRTKAQVAYTHQFKTVDMDIAGDFGLSNFNNHPNSPTRQKKFTSGAGHLGFKSTDDNLPVLFNAETNLMLYSRAYNFINNGDALKESLIRTKADVTGLITDEQTISLGVEMNNRFLNQDYKNSTSILLNPYYELKNNNWKLHVGANADFAFGFGDKFSFSPDVVINYIFSDSYIVYAKATGGRMMNDFRRLEMYNPHGELHTTQLKDSYEQINASAGFKASPFAGVWFNFYAGYQKIKNDLFCELEFVEPTRTDPAMFYNYTNTSNVFVGGDLSYNYKDMFILGLNAKYYNWDADNELAYLLKPAFDFGIQLDFKPFKALNIGLDYSYTQRAKATDMERLKAVNNLNIGATYEIFENIGIYARATNVFNTKHAYYLNYIDQGMSFLGGMSFRF
ncbi:TonB-dependent receptor [Bacteroides sp. 519]|nr:TonB-dependent receptor [Bacteroides sp. 519]